MLCVILVVDTAPQTGLAYVLQRSESYSAAQFSH